MAYRKCLVCNGTGRVWGTPPLIENGGIITSNAADHRLSDQSDSSFYGLEVKCWQCAGKGQIYNIANKGDPGNTNG